MASPPPDERPGWLRTIADQVLYCIGLIRTWATIVAIGIVFVSILAAIDPNTRNVVSGVWRCIQLLITLLGGVMSVSSTILGLCAKLWCAIPGLRGVCRQPITLEFAAHHVKHTAVTSLDVFQSFAHGMEASRVNSVSYVVLWAMSDTASELDRSANMPEAARLASSLIQLKDTVMHVEDGVKDLNRAGWQAFSEINRWIGRVQDEIVRQHEAGVVDAYELHTILAQLGTASRARVDDLIARIDKTFVYAEVGQKLSSEVRRDAMEVHDELTKRLDDRSIVKRTREAWSHAIQKTDEHLKNVQSVRAATDVVQEHLRFVRGHLKLYTSNAANFHSQINAMEILSLKQELRELDQLGNRIQQVLDEAARMNRGSGDA